MNEPEEEKFDYGAYSRRKYVIVLAGLLLAIGMFFADVLISSASYLNPSEVLRAMLHPGDVSKTMHVIVWDIKVPMAVMGLIVGAAFGFAGAVMQTMLNNPLASPYTLGISAGAGFGASFAMVMGLGSLAVLGSYVIPAMAFVFALAACGGIFLVAKMKRFTADIMVLAGIGLVFLFQAMQSLMQYLASPEALQGIVFWTFGSLGGANWDNIPIVLVVFILVFVLLYRKTWALTAMELGDNKAKSLGIDVEGMRKRMFVLTSLMTAVAVAFVGCIGFIGVIAPHISRMLLGEDQRFLLPMSCLVGSSVILAADIASRVFNAGTVYPIGILTAIVGVPFFFFLLIRKKTGGPSV